MSLAIVLVSIVSLTLAFNALRGTDAKCDFLRQKANELRYIPDEELSWSQRRLKNRALRRYNEHC